MTESQRRAWNTRMRGRAMAGLGRKYARLLGARRLRRRRYNYPSIKAEPKHYETYLATTAVPSNNTFADLEFNPSATSLISTPAVGDSYNNRDGKKIIITQVEIKGVINLGAQLNQTAPPAGRHGWIALVLDTQCNGATLASEDVFMTPDPTSAAVYATPFRNLLTGGRFRILKMKKWTFNNQTFSWDGTNMEIAGNVRTFKIFKKLRLPVDFNAGTTASVANVQNNALHVLAWASDATQGIAYNARIRFIG